jgi:hypothetical protein
MTSPKSILSDLEKDLELLMQWSQNSTQLIPEITIKRGMNVADINIARVGYGLVDRIIHDYDAEIKINPSLMSKYPKHKIHTAGEKCYEDLSRRFEMYCQRAYELGIISHDQLLAINRRPLD